MINHEKKLNRESASLYTKTLHQEGLSLHHTFTPCFNFPDIYSPATSKRKVWRGGGQTMVKGPLIIRFFTEERHMTFCFYSYPPFQKRHENFYENFLSLIHVNWFLCLPLARSDHRATGKCAK